MSEEKATFEGIIVVAYPEEEKAKDILEKANEAEKQKTFQFWDAAVVRKDEKGHYHYNEAKDMSTPRGAGIGAVVGGLLGLPGGPAGIVLGAGLGAAIGGFAANTDAGVNDDRLEDVGHALQSGNSALLIVSSHDYLLAMREYAADEYTTRALEKLTTGISEHMVKGQSVAYLITSAGRSVSCHRLRDDNIAELLDVEISSE
jgi:uncharacterized membrane protein